MDNSMVSPLHSPSSPFKKFDFNAEFEKNNGNYLGNS